MNDPDSQNTLRMQRRFKTTPDRLYECFTDAKHLAAWFGPEGVQCEDVTVDARVGGEYQLKMVGESGTINRLAGQFQTLDPPRRIQMTWQWQREPEASETLLTLDFSSVGDETLLELVHERFPDMAERDRHQDGWSSSFNCLEQALMKMKR